MSTAPANEAPDSLQPPAFVSEPAAGAAPVARPFGLPLPWARVPARKRSLLGWTIAFALLLTLPFADTNGGDIDTFSNAGTFVLLALGLNVVVGFAGLLDLGYAAFFALGAYAYGRERLNGRDAHTFDLAAELVVNAGLGRLVSASYPLEQYREAIDHAANAGRRGATKIVFDLRHERERRL